MNTLILKILGSLFVIGGFINVGIFLILKRAARIRILKDLDKSLQYFYGEIEFAAPDMTEMMERLSFRGGAFGEFFLNMRGRLLSHQGKRFADYWREEMPYIQGVENLLPEDRDFFLQIGENLGNLDRTSQLNMIQGFREKLADMIFAAEKEERGKVKITLVTCVTAGIFLAILLL